MICARTGRLSTTALVAVLALAGCAIGPNYHRPDVPKAAAWRENSDWKPATPAAISADQPWWSIFADPELDRLERMVEVSNQTLQAAEANYRAAQAAVGIDRGSLLPGISVGANGSRSGGAGNAGVRQLYSVAASGDWSLDVWGRIRRTLESDRARARASGADLAAARLSAQVTLAQDYFQLRAADEQQRLLLSSITAFQEAVTITRNRVQAGVTTLADVYQAQTQLETTQVQLIGTQLTRARLEHAIAVLVGHTPQELTLTPGGLANSVPVVPVGLPSELLQRRPDVVASEQGVISANAQRGVALAAWFPSLSITGTMGYQSGVWAGIINASNAVWSVGPSVAETIFNGGARRAQGRQARANYDAAVASYRQTVLTALQQVEDSLAALRLLEQQSSLEVAALEDARRSEALTLNQYKAGIAAYSSVITAQTTRLSSEVGALSIQNQRLIASAQLVNDIGGSWQGGASAP
jgi:NodT family efflux transporter outer membrane factor (OMF) lipoprotein